MVSSEMALPRMGKKKDRTLRGYQKSTGTRTVSGARRREDGSPPGRDAALASGSVHDSRPEGRALQFFHAFLRDARHQNKYF